MVVVALLSLPLLVCGDDYPSLPIVRRPSRTLCHLTHILQVSQRSPQFKALSVSGRNLSQTAAFPVFCSVLPAKKTSIGVVVASYPYFFSCVSYVMIVTGFKRL